MSEELIETVELACEVATKLVNQPTNAIASLLQKLGAKELRILRDEAKSLSEVKKRGNTGSGSGKELQIKKQAKQEERTNLVALTKLKDNISIAVSKWAVALQTTELKNTIGDVHAQYVNLDNLSQEGYFENVGSQIVQAFGAMEKASILNHYNFGRLLYEGGYMNANISSHLKAIKWPYCVGRAQSCVRTYMFVKNYPNLLLIPDATGFRADWVVNHGPHFRNLLDAHGDLFRKPKMNHIKITTNNFVTLLQEAEDKHLTALDYYEKPSVMEFEDEGEIIGRTDGALAVIAQMAITTEENNLIIEEADNPEDQLTSAMDSTNISN